MGHKTISSIFLLINLAFSACAQLDQDKGYVLDPSIQQEAVKHISNSELTQPAGPIQIYNNKIDVELYEDDVLKYSSADSSTYTVFKSFYYWKNDSLCIDGAYGLFGGTGFSICIVKDHAQLFHLLASDEDPSYAATAEGPLEYRLEVPCKQTKIILSHLPTKKYSPVIYGYVEFQSENYFQWSGSVGDKELPRKKEKANMKIYFKSARIDF